MTDLVSFADFTKLDMRVGTIAKVEVPSGSAHVYRLTIDFGKETGERIIFSGLKQTHEVKDLEGKQAVFVVNLEPKKVMGEESQGMLLAVDYKSKPVMIIPEERVDDGAKAH